MTTDNRTNEQIVQKCFHVKQAVLAAIPKGARTDREALERYRAARDAIVAALPYLEKHFMGRADAVGDPDEGGNRECRCEWDPETSPPRKVCTSHCLTATGRLAGEPSEAQVERAAKAFYETASGLTSWDRLAKHEPHLAATYRDAMIRALTAAGVAPQAESERTPEFESREQELFKHQPLLSMADGGIAGCQCMDRVFYGKTEDWGTHLAEVFDVLSAPVQPSSTVDEAKLVRIAYAASDIYHAQPNDGSQVSLEKLFARAVVEAIGGEGQ